MPTMSKPNASIPSCIVPSLMKAKPVGLVAGCAACKVGSTEATGAFGELDASSAKTTALSRQKKKTNKARVFILDVPAQALTRAGFAAKGSFSFTRTNDGTRTRENKAFNRTNDTAMPPA